MNTMLPVTSNSPALYADALAGYSCFLNWAGRYGQNLTECDTDDLPASAGRAAVFLALSEPLSASFNFGYDAADQSIFIAVEAEEFDWLTMLPVTEILVGRAAIYILTRPIDLDQGEFLPPLAIRIMTNQPLLWQSFPKAVDIGFMCCRVHDGGYEVVETHANRYSLRFAS